MCQDDRKQIAVSLKQSVEASLTPSVQPTNPARATVLVLLGEQEMRKRRYQRSGEQVGTEHREDDGDGERVEKKFRWTREQDHGKEDDADRQSRRERGNGDLLRAVEDRPHQALSQVPVAIDIFDLHRSVVDQHADGQGEAAQRHQVEGLPSCLEPENADQDGNGN